MLIIDPINTLITDISECPGFQSLLGVRSPRSVLDRIYLDGLPEPPAGSDILVIDPSLRPYILIYPSESDSYRFRTDGTPRCIFGSGHIDIVISLPYPADKTPHQAWLQIAAAVEPCVWTGDPAKPGLLDNLGIAERLQIMDLQLAFAGRTPPTERLNYGDAYDILMHIQYGGS